jgi:hypothetical protein
MGIPPYVSSITRTRYRQATTNGLLHKAGATLDIGLFFLDIIANMSFDQLSSLESQPTTMRRQDDPQYADDPEFQRLSQELMSKLFTLTGNISRLSNEIALLGTKRDTERVRERVHDLLEESKDTFKEVGEGVKKIQSWEDVSVSWKDHTVIKIYTNYSSAFSKIYPAEACPRVPEQPPRVPRCTATSS